MSFVVAFSVIIESFYSLFLTHFRYFFATHNFPFFMCFCVLLNILFKLLINSSLRACRLPASAENCEERLINSSESFSSCVSAKFSLVFILNITCYSLSSCPLPPHINVMFVSVTFGKCKMLFACSTLISDLDFLLQLNSP